MPQANARCGFSEGALAIRDTGPGPEDKTQSIRTPRAQSFTTRQVSTWERPFPPLPGARALGKSTQVRSEIGGRESRQC